MATVTMAQLEAQLGRRVSVNEWRVANGKAPIVKQGRKCRMP